jgi:hypothetical protein
MVELRGEHLSPDLLLAKIEMSPMERRFGWAITERIDADAGRARWQIAVSPDARPRNLFPVAGGSTTTSRSSF